MSESGFLHGEAGRKGTRLRGSSVGRPSADFPAFASFCPSAFSVKMSASHDGLWENRDMGNFVLKLSTLLEGEGRSHFSTSLKGCWVPGHLAGGTPKASMGHGILNHGGGPVPTSGSQWVFGLLLPFRLRAGTQGSPIASQDRVLNSSQSTAL